MPHKICVVDDEDLFRQALAEDLHSQGFEVFEAGNGVDGLRVALESQAEIVIVDGFMPGMGGADLLELVREAAPHVGRIAISGADPERGDWVVDALSAANAFSPKPINLPRLCGQIRMLLRSA